MGYYPRFPTAIPHLGARSIALLTLPPLSPLARFSFDLHVLAMPPAFNLSQDQTLQLKSLTPASSTLAGLGSGEHFTEGLPVCTHPTVPCGTTGWAVSIRRPLARPPDRPPAG